ncbi:MAG TPA: hypothetical protein VMU94_04020 [Streptosporangiaceae bacterium]|nr:hypothetical protein [Streptosporangiaceae bacterium]
MTILRRRRAEPKTPSGQKLLTRAAPPAPGRFSRAETVDGFVILGWDTSYGTVGWAHSLRFGTSVSSLASAVYDEFREHRHKAYAALALPMEALGRDQAPRIQAIDLYPDDQESEPYEVKWRQLAAVLGARPPWFSPALRDRDAIGAWKPGDPPAVIPADDTEVSMRALIELAVDEPDGSPAAAVCLWLARHLRRRGTEYAEQFIAGIRAAAVAHPDRDCAYVDIAAVPAPLLRPEDEQPAEMIMRAGWAQIVERCDVLAAAAAEAVLCWDGGKAWPVGQTAKFDPDSCPAAAQWTAGLRPALRPAADRSGAPAPGARQLDRPRRAAPRRRVRVRGRAPH